MPPKLWTWSGIDEGDGSVEDQREEIPCQKDREALDTLAINWGFEPNDRISVVGRLQIITDIHDGVTHGWLKELVHARTGAGLAYPNASGRMASAYVSGGIARQSAQPDEDRLPADEWYLADLELSPAREREKHENPYACSVQPGSLRALSTLPENWEPMTLDLGHVRLIAEGARAAIERRLDRETQEKRTALNHELDRAEAEIDRAQRALTTATKATKNEKMATEAARLKRSDQERRLAEATASFERNMTEMQDRTRKLAEFVAERGRRLIALDLLDEADLEAAIPPMPAPTDGTRQAIEEIDGGLQGLAGFVQAWLWQRDIAHSRARLKDVLTVLRTHDLVVLAGDSGSGKTSLVRRLAEALGGRCHVIPVKPNWTGPEDLLGYYNPIEGRYRPTPFLEALLAASREPEVLHLICLDEMNLARVEHYFADFLSLLEDRSGTPDIPLYAGVEQQQVVAEARTFLSIEAEARRIAGLQDGATLEDLLFDETANNALHRLSGLAGADTILTRVADLRRKVAGLLSTPARFAFPTNVRIVGTINVDDTTHFLSPKILDRAHVLRFRSPGMKDWDLIEAEIDDGGVDVTSPLQLAASDLGLRGEYPRFARQDDRMVALAEMARAHLEPLGVEFGLRSLRQSAHYLEQAALIGLPLGAALNNVILHKVLPRLHIELTGIDRGAVQRDALAALRNAMVALVGPVEPFDVVESCIDALDRMIAAAENGNGIVNFWTTR